MYQNFENKFPRGVQTWRPKSDPYRILSSIYCLNYFSTTTLATIVQITVYKWSLFILRISKLDNPDHMLMTANEMGIKDVYNTKNKQAVSVNTRKNSESWNWTENCSSRK